MTCCDRVFADIAAINGDTDDASSIPILTGGTNDGRLSCCGKTGHESLGSKAQLPFFIAKRAAARSDRPCFRGVHIRQTKFRIAYRSAIAVDPDNRPIQ